MKSPALPASSDSLQITVYWGDILYDTAICAPSESVSIGNRADNTFILDCASFKLVDVHADRKADLYFNDGLDGHIRVDDQLLSLRSAKDSKHVTRDGDRYRVSLSGKDKADIVIGHVSFYFDWISHGELLPRSPIVEKKAAWVLLVLLLFSAGVIALTILFEAPEKEKPPERLVMLEPRRVKSPPANVATPSTEAPSKAAMGTPKTKDGGAQKGDPGKVETKMPETLSAAASLRKANLGSLVNGLTTVGANAPSVNNTDGAVTAPIQQAGTGGFTTEGIKQGAGGKSVGLGRTVGQGEGGFSGTGRLGLHGNSSVEGDGNGNGGGATKVGGGLDRDVIESIIRRRLDRIRLCYERQLNFFPKLAGKVTVHFVIGKTGAVMASGAVEDTMKNEAVRSCILTEVKSWSFPAPEGGTLVNVNYPFVFESTAKTK